MLSNLWLGIKVRAKRDIKSHLASPLHLQRKMQDQDLYHKANLLRAEWVLVPSTLTSQGRVFNILSDEHGADAQ